MDVHHSLASSEIRPLHQLMEEMLMKMVDSVRAMVGCYELFLVADVAAFVLPARSFNLVKGRCSAKNCISAELSPSKFV